MAFKKELCTGKEGHPGERGRDGQFVDGVVDFTLPFFVELKCKGLFLLSAHTCSKDLFVFHFFFIVGITSVGIMPSYPECQP